jgi:hypothetical protein
LYHVSNVADNKLKKMGFILNTFTNEKGFLFVCGSEGYQDLYASPGITQDEAYQTLVDNNKSLSYDAKVGRINCIAQGAIIYSPAKWDKNGNKTHLHVFLPKLEEKYFTPNTFLIDCYNAVVKAIKTNGFVGDYYPHSDSMSTMLCTSIVNNMADYKGERYLNYRSNWNGQKFESFSDEPMDYTKHGFGEPQTYISVDLYHSNKGKKIRQVLDPMVLACGVDDIIDLYGNYK